MAAVLAIALALGATRPQYQHKPPSSVQVARATVFSVPTGLPLQQNVALLFVHPVKCGGTSVRQAMFAANAANWTQAGKTFCFSGAMPDMAAFDDAAFMRAHPRLYLELHCDIPMSLKTGGRVDTITAALRARGWSVRTAILLRHPLSIVPSFFSHFGPGNPRRAVSADATLDMFSAAHTELTLCGVLHDQRMCQLAELVDVALRPRAGRRRRRRRAAALGGAGPRAARAGAAHRARGEHPRGGRAAGRADDPSGGRPRRRAAAAEPPPPELRTAVVDALGSEMHTLARRVHALVPPSFRKLPRQLSAPHSAPPAVRQAVLLFLRRLAARAPELRPDCGLVRAGTGEVEFALPLHTTSLWYHKCSREAFRALVDVQHAYSAALGAVHRAYPEFCERAVRKWERWLGKLDVVGLTERWDESFMAIALAAGVGRFPLIARNRASRRIGWDSSAATKHDDISDGTRALIGRSEACGVRIYERWAAHFERSTAEAVRSSAAANRTLERVRYKRAHIGEVVALAETVLGRHGQRRAPTPGYLDTMMLGGAGGVLSAAPLRLEGSVTAKMLRKYRIEPADAVHG